MNEIKWYCTASKWDDDDYTVSIRPEFEPVWHDVPIGPTLTEREANTVANWLNGGGLRDLWKIAENVQRKNEQQKGD
jgi:hypothetical protein